MGEIGTRLRQARKSKGLTLRAVSESTGLSYQAIGQYERGERKISVEQLARICSTTGIPITHIIEGLDDESANVPDELTRKIKNSVIVRKSSQETMLSQIIHGLDLVYGAEAGDTAIWFMRMYVVLNHEGQEQIKRLIQDFVSIPKYRGGG